MACGSPNPVFDVCDDWFGREHDGHYRRMCSVCHVVVSSERLGERVLEETGKVATYIPEPWELAEGSPKEPSSDPLFLWFGHSSNLPTIQPYLGRYRILVCSNVRQDASRGLITYSPENLQKCLEVADCVLIPQNKDWKSANRMVESLHAGRFCIAADIPAYRGFSQYLGDIDEGIEWLKSGPIMERIISGRKELASFSPEAVGEKWLNCISDVVAKSSGITST